MTKFKKDPKFGGFVKPLIEVVEKHKSREFTNEEMVETAQQMKRMAEKDLDAHFENMLEKAKRLVCDIERQKTFFYSDHAKVKSDHFQYTLDEVNNFTSNNRMSDAAQKLAKFIKADTALKIFKGEDVTLW